MIQRYGVLSSGFLLLALAVFVGLISGSAFADDREQWTLGAALGLPEEISLTGEHWTRYETLNSQFRANSTGSDQILSLRTLVRAQWRLSPQFRIQAELQDARAELADEGSRMNTSIVNAAELLEANFTWTLKDIFAAGDRLEWTGGRLTMDIGKRRIVARYRFRNTIQAYTGLDGQWTGSEGDHLRIFWTLPVHPRPEDQPSLLANDVQMDQETLDRMFWGVFYAPGRLFWGNQGEVYVFGLHERDGEDFPTRNRQIYTPGFRFYHPARPGAFDFELESMFQFGTSRATSAPGDARDLDHQAHFHHFEVGYTHAAPWSPRFYLEYDYASGDDDPNDGTNDRFDLLFGPNVPEFGPTSINSAFVRGNLSSPGARLQVRPHPTLFAYLSYRAFWLASGSDGWAGASELRDITGRSGKFLGHLLFLRAKWKAHPNLRLESGLAYRIDGNFQKTVPNSPREGNTLYTYIQTTLEF